MCERDVDIPRPARQGAVLGLLAAALFGISAPLAKVLLGTLRPQILAGALGLDCRCFAPCAQRKRSHRYAEATCYRSWRSSLSGAL
jgi:hypothetical protein